MYVEHVNTAQKSDSMQLCMLVFYTYMCQI